jgi:hypothetical protein
VTNTENVGVHGVSQTGTMNNTHQNIITGRLGMIQATNFKTSAVFGSGNVLSFIGTTA